jgi:16S rRNA (guanine527-N7)-methyltransferase
MNLQEKLSKSISKLQLEVDQSQQANLIRHIKFLDKWNKVHNLTAIKQLDDMLVLHVLDCLSINKYLQGNVFLDLGSGAGFPGLPLSILNPSKKFVLLDANNKKCQFLQYVINELNLSNVSVVQSRIESFKVEKPFDGVMARALASVEWIYSNGKNLVIKNGNLYLMLAKNVEISQNLKEHSQLVPIVVPGLNATRQLLIIKNLDN